MDNLQQHIEDREALKRVIRKGISGICNQENTSYPNICRYGHRSTLDQEEMVEKVFKLMTDEILPMDLAEAFSSLDSELEPED